MALRWSPAPRFQEGEVATTTLSATHLTYVSGSDRDRAPPGCPGPERDSTRSSRVVEEQLRQLNDLLATILRVREDQRYPSAAA
jgi:hypothetical protein